MNPRISASLLAAALALLGCSTPPPPTAPVAQLTPVAQLAPLPAVPAPDFTRELPLEPPGLAMGGRVCKLGSSCMELDQRPFEVCLVGGTKRCVDKGVEVIPAQGHEAPSSGGPVTVSHDIDAGSGAE